MHLTAVFTFALLSLAIAAPARETAVHVQPGIEATDRCATGNRRCDGNNLLVYGVHGIWNIVDRCATGGKYSHAQKSLDNARSTYTVSVRATRMFAQRAENVKS